VPVGGAPNDRALSLQWRRALGPGAVAAVGLLAILLVFAGGPAGVRSLALALAPAAARDCAGGAAGRAGGAADAVVFMGARWRRVRCWRWR
jgi:hypothetical protein